MTTTDITAAASLIRPILARQLSLCSVCYPPSHPDAVIIAELKRALAAFDRLVQVAATAEQRIKTVEMAASQATNALIAELYELRAKVQTEKSGASIDITQKI